MNLHQNDAQVARLPTAHGGLLKQPRRARSWAHPFCSASCGTSSVWDCRGAWGRSRSTWQQQGQLARASQSPAGRQSRLATCPRWASFGSAAGPQGGGRSIAAPPPPLGRRLSCTGDLRHLVSVLERLVRQCSARLSCSCRGRSAHVSVMTWLGSSIVQDMAASDHASGRPS